MTYFHAFKHPPGGRRVWTSLGPALCVEHVDGRACGKPRQAPEHAVLSPQSPRGRKDALKPSPDWDEQEMFADSR